MAIRVHTVRELSDWDINDIVNSMFSYYVGKHTKKHNFFADIDLMGSTVENHATIWFPFDFDVNLQIQDFYTVLGSDVTHKLMSVFFEFGKLSQSTNDDNYIWHLVNYCSLDGSFWREEIAKVLNYVKEHKFRHELIKLLPEDIYLIPEE